MFIQQADILWQTSQIFAKEVMKMADKRIYQKGDILFNEGDKAEHFYILIKGRLKLTIGDTGHVVYMVNKEGETFGWSSLIGREAYSASAECMEPMEVFRIDKDKLQLLLEKDPANGLIFLKAIAGMLGNRLIQSYRIISDTRQATAAASFGTGDLQEMEESQ